MIKTKKDLKKYLMYEKKLYTETPRHLLHLWLIKDETYSLWRIMHSLRHLEYHVNNAHYIRSLLWERRKNYLANKCGVIIHPNCAEIGLRIWHAGSVKIHPDARLGKNCQLHGDNCLGNKGTPMSGAPKIGGNVNVGVGASIIGPISIPDNVTIAANAVVAKTFTKPGIVLAGIPAKEIQKKAAR